jgi:hypothetical protein
MKATIKGAVIGPTARYLTLDDLPDPKTKRWVPRRKAEVIHAVRGGLLSKEDAMRKYNLTNAEFSEWESHYSAHGMSGLRVTHLQDYRL